MYDAHRLQNLHPFFGRYTRDAGCLCKIIVVEQLAVKSSTGTEKFAEPLCISDTIIIYSITHQVGIDIGVPVFMRLLCIKLLEFWHAAAPNMRKHIDDIVLGKMLAALTKTCKGKVNRIINYDSVNLFLRKTVHFQNTYASCQ